MTIRVKLESGGWSAPVASGKLAVKWGGTSWLHPAKARVKWGSGWIDTGYLGYPAAPTGLAVNAWNYDIASFRWTAGVGGAPTASYELIMNNQADNANQGSWSGAGTTSGNLAVADSTKYNVYVRAKSAAGLYSAFTGPLRISIGKPAVYYETTEPTSAPWSAAYSVNGYKDQIVGPAVPTSVVCSSVRYQISANAGFTSVLSPYNNREIYRIGNSGQGERFTWNAGSVDVTVDVADYWGNGGITGMICRGAGWSIFTNGTARAVGTITAIGTHYYTYQQGHTIPAVPNSYW